MPHSDVNDCDSSVHEDDDDQSECQYILMMMMILIEARMRENQNLRLPRFLGFHNFPSNVSTIIILTASYLYKHHFQLHDIITTIISSTRITKRR